MKGISCISGLKVLRVSLHSLSLLDFSCPQSHASDQVRRAHGSFGEMLLNLVHLDELSEIKNPNVQLWQTVQDVFAGRGHTRLKKLSVCFNLVEVKEEHLEALSSACVAVFPMLRELEVKLYSQKHHQGWETKFTREEFDEAKDHFLDGLSVLGQHEALRSLTFILDPSSEIGSFCPEMQEKLGERIVVKRVDRR